MTLKEFGLKIFSRKPEGLIPMILKIGTQSSQMHPTLQKKSDSFMNSITRKRKTQVNP